MSGTAVCPTCGASVGQGARFCATCGTPLTEAMPEERKLATILFADVIGSTDLGEQLDPERLRALLQDYFSAMAAVVDSWSGTIEKYIGDAILAVWGVPTAREDDPVRALYAARDMLAELQRINPDLEARHGVALGLRIGVNTGEVLAPVGARPAGQFLVSGDAVNVAARLQQKAQPGTVLVGERTCAGARGAFEFSEPTALEIKGKRAPVVARRLGEPIDGGADAANARPLQARMLGRDRELSTLLGLLDEVIEDAEPRLVLVSGPAGMGKSRLLRELIGTARENHPELNVLRGRCLATGHGITFWALGDILRQLCSISLDESADSAAAKLERRVAGPLAAVGLSTDEIARSAAALATSANLPLTNNPLSGLGPEELAEEMSQAWPRLLTGLARTQPIALVIEDVHWADEPMLRMLESIATRARGPLLIVATARPEFMEAHPGFGTAADLSVVGLRALTDAQSAHLIDELLGTAQLPATLREDIQRKAEGNPFFLEEIVQRLIDEGALIMSADGWVATERAANVQLPDTVYALLAARIDALPADEKRLLQEAAVVGRIFWPGALGAAVAADDVLRRAERRGLVSLRPTSTIANEPEYIFRHVLIRDVAYNSVPRKRRALAHAGTGRWVESLAADRLDEFAELLAYHYSAAVVGDDTDLGWAGDAVGREAVRRRAFEMLIRAGSGARRRFAIDKAIELHGQALAVADSDVERAVVHEELGDDHEALYHGDDAVREYLTAVDLLGATAEGHRISDTAEPDGQTTEVRGRLAGKAGAMIMRWGTFEEVPPVERIKSLVTESLDTSTTDRTRALLLIVDGGSALDANGVPVSATGKAWDGSPEEINRHIASLESGIEIARRLDDSDLVYLGTDQLYGVYHSLGRYDRLLELAEEQGALLDRLASVRKQVDSLIFLESAREDVGAFADALEAAEEGLRRSTSLNTHERVHAIHAVMSAADPLGAWDRIVELLPLLLAAVEELGDIMCPAVGSGPPIGGTILARRGQRAEALALVPLPDQPSPRGTFVAAAMQANYAALVEEPTKAHEKARYALSQSLGFLENGLRPMIGALLQLELYDELEAFLPTAESQADSAVLIPIAIERARGALALHRGDRVQAERFLRGALERSARISAPFETAQSQELVASIAGAAERESLLRAALENYESLGARPYAERVRNALAGVGLASASGLS